MQVPNSDDWPAADRASLRKRLLNWSQQNHRPLPWRDVRDPYRVWISEIMLQQTTVAAVVPYYERFLTKFPTVEKLARASEAEVLSLWEGLGYYSRGRNLHRAAGVIMSVWNGRFPATVDELRTLPGVGRYTAGAIASFGHDVRAAIVEANTLRLYARLMALTDDPRSTSGQQRLWRFAESLLPRRNVGRFNQALIDLGATVCTPRAPDCEHCPLRSVCRAFQQGRQLEIPAPKAAVAITRLEEVVFALHDGPRWLVRQRGPDERWAGMWDFPRLQRNASDADSNPPAASTHWLKRLRAETGLVAEFEDRLRDVQYSVTRYRIGLRRIVARWVKGTWAVTKVRWCSLAELNDLPMPMTTRAFVKALHDRLGSLPFERDEPSTP